LGLGVGRGKAPRTFRPVRFADATATLVRQHNDHTSIADGPQGMIDGSQATRWDIWPQTGKANAAFLLTRDPFGYPGGTVVKVTLDFQHPHWKNHNLGRFRLAVSAVAASWRWHAFLARPELNGFTKLAGVHGLRREWKEALAALRKAPPPSPPSQ